VRPASRPTLEDYAAVSAQRPVYAHTPGGKPLVSVITVTLNAARTLPRTINSIRAQTYPAVEHIVVDGGSTDTTLDCLRSLVPPPGVVLSERDSGISDAFNKGVALARGEFIQIINADDWLSENQIEQAVAVLTSSGADFVFGDLLCYDGDRATFRYRGDPNYAATIRCRMPPMNHPSMLVRRSAYERFGLFSLSLRNAMDYEWLSRVHRSGGRGVYDPRILAHMSIEGVSIRLFKRTAREVHDIAVAYGRNRLVAALEYRYSVSKTGLSHLVKQRSLPVYHFIRARINPAYEPIRYR